MLPPSPHVSGSVLKKISLVVLVTKSVGGPSAQMSAWLAIVIKRTHTMFGRRFIGGTEARRYVPSGL